MARTAAKKDPFSYTILINPDPNWHQQTSPFSIAQPDMHVITYIPLNTLQYNTPLTPIYEDKIYI
jgi:hypothetical protein